MRVMVTGGTGFLGSYIAKSLVDRGEQVTVIARAPVRREYVDKLGIFDSIAIEVVQEDYSNIDDIVDRAAPDVVIHTAALSRGGEANADIAGYIDANIKFGSLLLNAMRKSGTKAFVNCGTSWQSDFSGNYEPVNFYAATKQAFEDIILHYTMDGLAAINLRVFDPYGPHDRRNRIVDLLIEAIIQQKTLAMSPGGQKIDLIHVRDTANAFAIAADRAVTLPAGSYETFGVCSGDPQRLKDVAEAIGAHMGKAPPIEWGGRPYRNREVMVPPVLPTLPGWKAERNLGDSLAEILTAKD